MRKLMRQRQDRLGMAVPQGVPGTNPQKMSQAGCLVDR